MSRGLNTFIAVIQKSQVFPLPTFSVTIFAGSTGPHPKNATAL